MSQTLHISEFSKKKVIKIKPVKIYKSPSKKKKSANIPNPNINIKVNVKQNLYDRFIPYGISQNLTCDPPSYSQTQNGEKYAENNFVLNTLKKNNYEKCLLADLIGRTSPTEIITNDPKKNIGYITMLNSRRKVSYSKEKSNEKKKSILNNTNKSFYIDNDRYNLLSERNKRKTKKKIQSYKTIYFGDDNINTISEFLSSPNKKKSNNNNTIKFKIPDNFYYNVLDMFNLSSILISTSNGGSILIDYSGNECKINKINFKRNQNYLNKNFGFNNDENTQYCPKIICNKFMNNENNRFLSSTINGDLFLYDLNNNSTELIINHYDSPLYTFDILNEVVFMGEESGRIEVIDIRESHINNKNIYYLYTHPGKNEICKTIYSRVNNYVISGGNDNNGIIFDFRNYKIVKSITHKGAIKGMSINLDENYLISGGGNKDKMIKLWDLKKLKQVSETKANSQITAIEFINNNTVFTSFGYNENMSAVYSLNYDELDKENCSDMQLCNISLSSSVQSEINDIKDIFSNEDEFERHYKRILYTSVDKSSQYVANASEGELKIFKIGKYSKSKFDLEMNDSFICH